MVEFSLLTPVFLLVILATIDFSGYFGARLSVEQASRAGARVAVTEAESAYPSAAASVVTQVVSHANDAQVASTADCEWSGTTLSPTTYPPFTFTGTSCIGIWYFELTGSGSPALCTQFSVFHSAFGSYSGGVWTSATPGNGCVAPGSDIVVVGVGYHYPALTPLPALSGSALDTYGETQLLEED